MIKEVERLESLHERAKIIVEREKLHPQSHAFPKYLHLLEPTGEDGERLIDRPWEGLAGKIRQENLELKAALGEKLADVQRELLVRVDAQDKKLDDLIAMVASTRL